MNLCNSKVHSVASVSASLLLLFVAQCVIDYPYHLTIYSAMIVTLPSSLTPSSDLVALLLQIVLKYAVFELKAWSGS